MTESPSNPAGTRSGGTIDPQEIAKFEAMAAEWWRPEGKFKPLHDIGPARIGYIRDAAAAHFGRDPLGGKPLAGLRLVDIGCGGGLLTEPMARLGAEALGVDPASVNVEVARIHAAQAGLDIDYRATSAEALAAAGERFDVVAAMEVVEHVADLDAFIQACATLVRPGGLLFLSTINRTLRAWALAIVAAERVLRWLPPGTHDYDKLVRPDELRAALVRAGLKPRNETGLVFNPLAGQWRTSSDTGVNYMAFAEKPAG